MATVEKWVKCPYAEQQEEWKDIKGYKLTKDNKIVEQKDVK